MSVEHLYRINPDGSGKIQITRGRYVDEYPRWSPDGRYIYFRRYSMLRDWEKVPKLICRCNADGSGLRTIYQPASLKSTPYAPQVSVNGKRITFEEQTYWGPGSEMIHAHLLVNQDGKLIRKIDQCSDIVWSPFDNHFLARIQSDWYLFNPSLKKRYLPIRLGWNVTWITREKLICSELKDFNRVNMYTFDLSKQGAKPIQLNINAADPNEKDEGANLIYGLLNVPGKDDHVIMKVGIGGSSNRPYDEYQDVDLKTGSRALVARGQFVDWDKDRSHVLTSTPRVLAPYGNERRLYVSKLLVRQHSSETWIPIVQGRVFVHSASWRKK